MMIKDWENNDIEERHNDVTKTTTIHSTTNQTKRQNYYIVSTIDLERPTLDQIYSILNSKFLYILKNPACLGFHMDKKGTFSCGK